MVDVEIKKIYRPLFENDYSIFLYYGGRGSGKSYGVCDSLLTMARQGKKKFLICRETKESMEDSIVALYQSRIDNYGYSEFVVQKDYIYNKVTGSEFYFVGLNATREAFIQAIKSIPDIDVCCIEEAQSISKMAIDVLIPTVKRNAKGSKIIAIWNPLSTFDPVWQLVEKPRPRTYVQNVNYLDNTFCPAETIEEAEYCRINNPDDFKHIWLGYPKNMVTNAVVSHWSDANILPLHYQPEADLYLTCDFNVATMAWAVAHYEDDAFFYIDEICEENIYTVDCINIFIQRYRKHKGNFILCGDAAGTHRNTQSKKHNYRIIYESLSRVFGSDRITKKYKKSNPPVLKRVEYFNMLVKDNHGERRIYVDEKNCPNIIQTMNLWKFTEDGKSVYIPTPTDISNNQQEKWTPHLGDAVSYLPLCVTTINDYEY